LAHHEPQLLLSALLMLLATFLVWLLFKLDKQAS
jgi:hypothetical protein